VGSTPVAITRALSELSLYSVGEAVAAAAAVNAPRHGSLGSSGSAGRAKFRFGLFASLNPDQELLHQITRE
jgi:hypothetical protein